MLLTKVDVRELEQGMYVAKLDRPWLETPLLFQGFTIRDRGDIEEVARHCEYVYIDEEQGMSRRATADRQGEPAITISGTTPPPAYRSNAKRIKGITPHPGRYQDAVPVQEELVEARKVHRHLASVVNDIMDAARSGSAINSTVVREAVGGMVDSVLRNADAMAWLTQLRERGSPVYQHAINCSVWMIIFGRSLGLDRAALENLAMIGLLFDVGKSRLPPALVVRPQPLPSRQEALLRKHVEYGIAVLEKTPDIDPQVATAVWSHHERYNGSGYPNGLRGGEIPAFGAMAGIVDWYEATIHPYDGSAAASSVESIERLQQMRGIEYQAEIVDQFIQAIGIYPTGTLVELNSGEVGVVIAQNRTRRLQPKVIIITSSTKERLEAFETVDLLMQSTHGSGGELRIVKSLTVGAYGIDPAALYL